MERHVPDVVVEVKVVRWMTIATGILYNVVNCGVFSCYSLGSKKSRLSSKQKRV